MHLSLPLRTGYILAISLAIPAQALMSPTGAAAEPLRQPSICSAIAAGSTELQFPFCRVTPMPNRPGSHDVTLSLTATTSPADIGGYHVLETENYNGGYLAPVVELKPDDNFRIRLVNALAA